MEKRMFTENHFETSDGVSLYYKKWEADIENPDKAIVLFHRGHEHSGRVEHIVNELQMPDIPMFAWDARGHGMSPGKRGYSPSMGRTAQDIEEFIHHISEQNNIPISNIIVIAQSVGAVSALTWVHDYAPQIRGLVLASPAFDVKLYVPFAKQLIGLAQKITGSFFVDSYVKAKFLTHDPERIKSYNEDKLISKAIAANILLELYSVSERIIADAHSIKTPTLMLVSGADYVVNHKPQHIFYKNLGSEIKEKHIFDGFYHDTMGEKDRYLAIDKIKDFVNKIYSMPLYKHDYSNEDRWSVTADVLRELQAEPECCCKKAYFNITKFLLKTIGACSDGVKLGLDTGFDSGSSLDYVYCNKPSGKCLIGKIFDKIYLNSPGWVGIRARKINIEKIIIEAVNQLSIEGKAARIVDIAAGHGRYILDAIGNSDKVEKILLRDYSDINVQKGSALIKERGLDNKAEFEKGNAFSKDELSNLSINPNIAIVSGLYELFPNNDNIVNSLSGLANAVEKDGYLIYTNQPWHPQLEFIARVLSSHRKGEAWAMRCRTQGEIDALVQNAGFEKIMQLNDDNAIFTVSLARRV